MPHSKAIIHPKTTSMFEAARSAYLKLVELQEANSCDTYEMNLCRETIAEWTARKDRFKKFLSKRGERYANCSFESYVASIDAQRHVVERLRDYVADCKDAIRAGKNIILFGPKGPAKTTSWSRPLALSSMKWESCRDGTTA